MPLTETGTRRLGWGREGRGHHESRYSEFGEMAHNTKGDGGYTMQRLLYFVAYSDNT